LIRLTRTAAQPVKRSLKLYVDTEGVTLACLPFGRGGMGLETAFVGGVAEAQV
jgi:hypothetical protein